MGGIKHGRDSECSYVPSFKRQQRAASSRASLALLASKEEGGCLGYMCGWGARSAPHIEPERASDMHPQAPNTQTFLPACLLPTACDYNGLDCFDPLVVIFGDIR